MQERLVHPFPHMADSTLIDCQNRFAPSLNLLQNKVKDIEKLYNLENNQLDKWANERPNKDIEPRVCQAQ